MAYQGISTGAAANDGTGDSLAVGAVKINSNFSEIYNALGDGNTLNFSKTRTLTAGDGLTGGGNLTADRTFAVDSTVMRTSGNQTISGILTATTFVGNGTIPIGGIIMWSGSVATIPTGWALCNGSNATPDLRERFIVGAGGDNSTVAGTTGYNPGDNGGANTVALSVAEMPSHNHFNGVDSGSTSTTTTLTGSFNAYGFESGQGSGIFASSISNNEAISPGTGANDKNFIQYNINANHSHSISVNSQGGNAAHENRPPYYALAFIMRTA